MCELLHVLIGRVPGAQQVIGPSVGEPASYFDALVRSAPVDERRAHAVGVDPLLQ